MTTRSRGSRRARRWFVPLAAGLATLTLGLGPAGAALPTGPSTEHTSAGMEGSRELVAMSADGSREVFVGRNTQNQGLWLKDRSSGEFWRITTGMDFNPDISADGTTVAWATYGSSRPVYVMDVTDPDNPGAPVLVSRASGVNGAAANGLSDFPSLNADGTIVAFMSAASNLDADTPVPSSGGPNKVYVRDLNTDQTEMVSVDNSGAAQPGNAGKPDLDAAGTRVAFYSEADLLGPPAGALEALANGQPGPPPGKGGDEEEGETTTVTQIWIRDLTADESLLVSSDSLGVPGNGASAATYGPTISADGTQVAFESGSTNLVPADTNAHDDAFLKDMTSGAITRVSERTATDEYGAFHAVSPARVLDTRLAGGALAAGETRTLPVAGLAGVPADAVAVALNVTVTEPTAPGFLTAWPTGDDRPLASTINFTPGLTIANAATVKVGDDGSIDLYNLTGSTHVVVDVAGWYDGEALTAGGGFVSMPPVRALDTRDTGTPLGTGGTVDVPVAGVLGVPDDATAVALSLTAVSPTTPGFLTAWPTGEDRPLASNLNFAAGDTVANNVVVKVGDGGMVSIYNLVATTHVVVDVLGWYDATLPNGGFTSLPPARLLDTRAGAPVTSAAPRDLKVIGAGGVPAMGVTAVALNVTVTQPSDAGFLTVFPTGTTQPLASNQNFVAGETIAVQVLAQVGHDGYISLALGPALSGHVVVDVTGWYSGVQVSDGGIGAVVSGNGATVAFESLASTLTEGDANGVLDVFARDVAAQYTERASVVDETLGGTEATGTRTDGHTGEVVPQKNGTDAAIDSSGLIIAFNSNGNLTNDRTEDAESPGVISTEPAIYTRTRAD